MASHHWSLQPLHPAARHTQISTPARRRNWLQATERAWSAYLVLAECPWSYPSRTEPRLCSVTSSSLWLPHHQHRDFPHQTHCAAWPKWTCYEKQHAAITPTRRGTIYSPTGSAYDLHWRWFERYRSPIRRHRHVFAALLG